MDQQIFLVRYEVMANIRVHFSQLFFFVTAFSLLFSTIVTCVLRLVVGLDWPFVGMTGGVILALGALVSRRLQLRERGCFEQMQMVWRELEGSEPDTLELGRKLGAMEIVLIAQLLLSGAIVLLGFLSP